MALITSRKKMRPDIDQSVEEVFALYDMYGAEDYIGEPVSQIEHMSQAAQLAINGGHRDEIILAAFFHDIGHLTSHIHQTESMNGYGIKSHEKIGGDFLRAKGFPEVIATLVENHVEAKRYLTFKYPTYYHGLSDASKQTLEFQGGVMTDGEAEEFEKNPLFQFSILIRQWDEQAKETNIPILDLEMLKRKARSVLEANQSSMP
jgi:phosphonate degradation associated HDIG domain protein